MSIGTEKRAPTKADLLFAVVTVGVEKGRIHSRCVAVCTAAEKARWLVEHNASFLAEEGYYEHVVKEAERTG